MRKYIEELKEKCEDLEMSMFEVSCQLPVVDQIHQKNPVKFHNDPKLIHFTFLCFQTTSILTELSKFKEMWASSQCDLQDAEEKLKESEKERVKALSLLKSTIEELAQEAATVEDLKNQINETGTSGMNQERAKNVS
jgi:archaellum component FlaC